MLPGNRKRIGEFLILLIYLVIDGYSLWDLSWPIPHLWAFVAGVIGIVALLFLDGDFSEKVIARITTTCVVFCLIVYYFIPQKSPFNIVDTTKLITRTFPHGADPAPPIFAYAFHRGVLLAGNANNDLFQGVDLLIHVAITNQSGVPRRITLYGLEVQSSNSSPWVSLCPVNFRYSTMFFVGDPTNPFSFPTTDMLDLSLTEKSILPGDTVSGWIGWICPLKESLECRPALLRYTLVDSLGDISKYESSNAQADVKPIQDWMAEAVLRPAKVASNFSGKNFWQGNCPDGQIMVVPSEKFEPKSSKK